MKKWVLVFSGILCLLAGCGRTENTENEERELAKAFGLYESGEYEAAKAIFQDYVEVDACRETALIGLGKCSAAVGATEEALSAYNSVLEKDPENESCLYDRAVLYEQAGDMENAYYDYDALYEMNREDLFAWNKVETYLKENGLLEQLLMKCQTMKNEGEEQNIAMEIELLAELGRTEEIPAVIDRFEDQDFRQLCMKQLEAYNSLEQGDLERAKEILFSYENFMSEDMALTTVYIGSHDAAFQREGTGILLTDEYPDTQIYIGEWTEGKREGNGSAFNAYAGEYEDGGAYFDESILEGTWKNDLPNGMCEHTQNYYNFENEIQSYRSQESYLSNYVDGIVNGELILEKFGEDEYGNWKDSEKLMIENGVSMPFIYNGKEVYSVIYDKNGNVDYVNDSWRDNTSFKWDIY